MAIPIIDIFAGPGGLGEGFSALPDSKGKRVFKIVLSIEKDPDAHETLMLRSFFRQFELGQVPNDYYDFVQGKIALDELYKRWPTQAVLAMKEAWLATLGKGDGAINDKIVDERITVALNKSKDWLLIGGPPCQAYSVVGRVRRKKNVLDEEKDERVGLYKQYLRILAVHNPSVFVMENVKGLLSAKTKDSPVFSKILRDLKNPVSAYSEDFKVDGRKLTCPGYKIFSLVVKPKTFDTEGNPVLNHSDFLIRSENYGIPQTRHRVILLGIRNDIKYVPEILSERSSVSIHKVLSGLPRLRSKLSRSKDDANQWKDALSKIVEAKRLNGVEDLVRDEIKRLLGQVRLPHEGAGKEFITGETVTIDYQKEWFTDKRLNCNS